MILKGSVLYKGSSFRQVWQPEESLLISCLACKLSAHLRRPGPNLILGRCAVFLRLIHAINFMKAYIRILIEGSSRQTDLKHTQMSNCQTSAASSMLAASQSPLEDGPTHYWYSEDSLSDMVSPIHSSGTRIWLLRRRRQVRLCLPEMLGAMPLCAPEFQGTIVVAVASLKPRSIRSCAGLLSWHTVRVISCLPRLLSRHTCASTRFANPVQHRRVVPCSGLMKIPLQSVCYVCNVGCRLSACLLSSEKHWRSCWFWGPSLSSAMFSQNSTEWVKAVSAEPRSFVPLSKSSTEGESREYFMQVTQIIFKASCCHSVIGGCRLYCKQKEWGILEHTRCYSKCADPEHQSMIGKSSGLVWGESVRNSSLGSHVL